MLEALPSSNSMLPGSYPDSARLSEANLWQCGNDMRIM